MRKTLLLPLLLLACFTTAKAQFPKQLSASPLFAENLAKITRAFRNNYYQVQGGQLPSQDDMDVYSSTVVLPGAQHCVIYRFHSKNDTTASWQGIMYSGDNYKEALKIYKHNCRQVNRCKVNLDGNTAAVFTGKIDEPETDLRFVSSVFSLNTKDDAYGQFYAEVELVNINYDQWEVRLNLQNKKDDDEK
ncbi:MAG: hypothetical protein ABI741_07115 [Ferruginibacter sp.]